MHEIFTFFAKKEVYMTIINIVIYILIGYILYRLIKGILIKSLKINKKKRQQTITKLMISIIKIVIVTIEVILILSLFGVNVTSLLAGVGIASVVIGLALQDIMKDVLAGAFIIFDDQFDVDDLVEINGFTGTVISVGIKTTKLKNYEGKIRIISNRNISEVTNYSKANSFAIVDIPVSYEENLEHVEKIISKIATRINKEVENLVSEVQILGIDALASSSINYRIMVEVKPTMHYAARRIMHKIIKEEFDKANITIPYNKLEVINGK